MANTADQSLHVATRELSARLGVVESQQSKVLKAEGGSQAKKLVEDLSNRLDLHTTEVSARLEASGAL